MKRKIMIICASGVGGAERITCLFTKYLLSANYEIVFYIIKENKRNVDIEQFVPDGVKIKYIRTKRFFLSLLKRIEQEKPDIVFASSIPVNIKLCLCKILKPNIKVVVRNNIYLSNENWITRLLVLLTYRWANKVIAQTEEMKDELGYVSIVDKSKVVVLHNPIDTVRIQECLQETSPFEKSMGKIYVAVGRFCKQKGYDMLIRAFKRVLLVQPESQLYIIGHYDKNSEYYKDVAKYVEKEDLSRSVHFTGLQNNPYKYIQYADCFILSSRTEGLPNVLIESQYIGIPAAAFTCIPIIERIVKDGETGYLSKPNDIDGLAKAMIKASTLGHIESCFHPASKDSIINIFKQLF